MSRNEPSSRLPETDYTAIEAAVMETARGRWFLAEYARRNRSADTKSILEAIARLEEMAGLLEPPPSSAPELPNQVLKAIRELRETPWQGVADGTDRPLHQRPARALRSANGALRSSAEKIREVALELRETAKLDIYAKALELYCADLVSAASLQEAASARLTDLASLIETIEASSSANAASARPEDDADEPRRAANDTATANAAPPSIAPSDPPRLSSPTSAGKEEARSTTDSQSAPSANSGSPVLMFVKPD